MPKISYLAKAKNGKDDTEVTALQIEQKIADIEALLRGMIDEDNMLCADNGTKIVPMSPSNVVDMPIETRPVNHSMKFFGYSSTHQNQIVSTLFDSIVEIEQNNPAFSTLNGIGDKEIVFDITIESDTNMSEREFSKTINIEVPTNYVPMKWSDLWLFVYNFNVDVSLQASGDNPPKIEGSFADITDFYEQLGVSSDEMCWELSQMIPADMWYSELALMERLELNDISLSVSASVPSDVGAWLARFVPTILCKVNP